MVVCFHVGGNLRRDRYLGEAAGGFESFFSFGDAGVSFFFVLSGFIVTWVHLRDFNVPDRLGRYLFKRAARIYPIYWIVFVIAYAAAYFSPSLRDTVPQDAFTLIKSLLLLPQDPLVVGGLGAPVLFVAWSLQYEMLFYIAMGLAIVRQWLLIIPVLLYLINQFVPIFGEGYLHTFFANPRIYLFIMGVALAYVARERWTIRKPMVLVLVCAAAFAGLSALSVLALLPGDRSDYVLAYGAISTLGLFGLIRMEDAGTHPSNSNWMVKLGDASYVLYLIHVPVLSALSKLARSLAERWGPIGPTGATLTGIAIVIACCVAAMAFHILVERPIGKQLNTLLKNWLPIREKIKLVAN